jgi:hypothetical protein
MNEANKINESDHNIKEGNDVDANDPKPTTRNQTEERKQPEEKKVNKKPIDIVKFVNIDATAYAALC